MAYANPKLAARFTGNYYCRCGSFKTGGRCPTCGQWRVPVMKP